MQRAAQQIHIRCAASRGGIQPGYDQQVAEKHLVFRLLKNVQMQDTQNSEE